MSRSRNPVPTYRKHAPSGRAVCTVRLPGGGSRDLYLGAFGSAASRAEYARVVALVSANGGAYPVGSQAPDLTVAECLLRYVRHIDAYYRRPDGTPTGTAADIKVALGYVRRLFARHPAAEFRIPELKAVRDAMVADGRVRNQVNKRVSMIRSFARWCVEERLMPAEALAELRAVRPLAAGRGGAKDREPVKPADPAAVEKALPYMPPAVGAVVKLLRLTGARPSEILTLRPADLDCAGAVWALAPGEHKTRWRGAGRVVYLGPDAQEVLSPWLAGCGPDEFVFTPAKSEAIRRAAERAARKTKRWPSHMERNAAKRAAGKPRRYAPRYNRTSLLWAVIRACRKAGVAPFSPYQLRHLKAVELRERFGLETVRAVLGHRAASMADHYSRAADGAIAARAMAAAG